MSSQKPTILHVIDTTGPGGAETVFTQLAHASLVEGYNSIALIRGPGWVQSQIEKLGVEFHVIDCKGSFNVVYLAKLIRLIKNERITAIQSHLLGSNVYCSIAGLITGVPVISTFHGHVDISPNERFRSAKFAIIAAGSKAAVAVVEDLCAAIKGMGNTLLAKKVIVIANGIETSELEQLAVKPLPQDSETPIVFGSLGNIRKAKNYFLAVDFIAELLNQGVYARLQIAGDDTKLLAAELRQYITEKGLDNNIQLLGYVDDVPGFLDNIDVFLMTSSTEGHPLALTQAMAAAKPILTTPSGVERIVQDGDSAYVSSEHSVTALIGKFGDMRSNSAALENVRAASRQCAVKQYSLTVMCESYIRLYRAN